MTFIFRIIYLPLLLAVCLPAFASSVLPLSLQQLSQQADRIFYAKVIASQSEKDPLSGQIVTYTDFDIIETIKGPAASHHRIKQLGGNLPGSRYALHVPGVPEFVSGKEYVVFLPKASSLGFCSPLGLHQGSFDVQLINGEKIISNGRNPNQASNTPLQANIANTSRPAVTLPLATSPTSPAQSRLTDFIYSIRTLTTE